MRRGITYQLERLPYTERNTSALTQLSKREGSIGGVAAGALFNMRPNEHSTLLDKILRRPDDFNYIQTFVNTSKHSWSANDFDFLIQKLRQKRKKVDSLTIFGELILELVPMKKLISWCADYIREKGTAKYALIEALRSHDSQEARSILLNLIKTAREPESIYALYSNLEFNAKNFVSGEIPVDTEVADHLISTFASEDGEWAISLAKQLIEKNSDWRGPFTSTRSKNASTRLLLDIVCNDDSSLSSIVSNATTNVAKLDNYALRILGAMDFWRSASTSSVLAALCNRNYSLAGAILEQLQGKELPLLSVRKLDWWLDWEEECLESHVRSMWWCGYMIGRFLNDADEETRNATLARFNARPVGEFERIGRLVLREGAGRVSTEQLSKTAIARLLHEGRNFDFAAAVLGKAATEEFVRTVLLPIWQQIRTMAGFAER